MLSKKLILVLGLVFFFLGGRLARADVVISEIMYDPVQSDSYNEWIELYNNGNREVDLTNLLICNKSVATGYIKHSNGSLNQDNGFMLGVGKFAVITDGNTSNGDISGTEVYDYYSINNSALALHVLAPEICGGLTNAPADPGKTITLSDSSFSNSVTYTSLSNAVDGNSLQLTTVGWKPSLPTPGEANEIITPPPPADDSSNSGSSSSSSSSSASNTVTPEPKIKIVEIPKIKTQIIAKTLGFVGLPLSLDATTLGLSGEQLRYGKYFWNFDDGDSKEVNLSDSQSFAHTYFYPGDYVVSLDYFSNPYIYSNIPDASNQINIKIIEADISISRVGDEKDFFVELSNNTDYSVDLSNWFLTSDAKSFTIPRNTILAAKKKMIISPKIANFSIADKDTLKLMNPEREVVFDYSASIVVPKIVPVSVSKTPTLILPLNKGEMPKAEGVYSETEIPTNNLSASAISSISNDTAKNNPNNSYLPIFISIIFIGASASAVYFIRRKKVISQVGSDFEILDE